MSSCKVDLPYLMLIGFIFEKNAREVSILLRFDEFTYSLIAHRSKSSRCVKQRIGGAQKKNIKSANGGVFPFRLRAGLCCSPVPETG